METTIRLYSLHDLESILGVSYRTLIRYIHANKLQAKKVCGKWLVREESLLKFIEGE